MDATENKTDPSILLHHLMAGLDLPVQDSKVCEVTSDSSPTNSDSIYPREERVKYYLNPRHYSGLGGIILALTLGRSLPGTLQLLIGLKLGSHRHVSGAA